MAIETPFPLPKIDLKLIVDKHSIEIEKELSKIRKKQMAKEKRELTPGYMKAFMRFMKALVTPEDIAEAHKFAFASAGGAAGKRGPKEVEMIADIIDVEQSYVDFIEKAVDDEKRLVTGIVMKPDVPDAHGDTTTAEEIRKAHEGFMLRSQEMNAQHDRMTGDDELDEYTKASTSDDTKLVESYLAPNDLTIGNTDISKGSWIMTVKVIDDTAWSLVKSGKLTGFSIQGTGNRVAL